MGHRLPTCRILEAILPAVWRQRMGKRAGLPAPNSGFAHAKEPVPPSFFSKPAQSLQILHDGGQQRLFFHGVKTPASGPVQPVTFLPFGEHMLTTRAKGLNGSIAALLLNEPRLIANLNVSDFRLVLCFLSGILRPALPGWNLLHLLAAQRHERCDALNEERFHKAISARSLIILAGTLNSFSFNR